MNVRKYCLLPFEHIELHTNGKAYTCCPSYVKTDIGDYRNNSIDSLWNGEAAKKIRKGIKDGSFSECKHDKCPFLIGDKLTLEDQLTPAQRDLLFSDGDMTFPSRLMLVNDPSCNLACPSCRPNKIGYEKGSYQQILLETESMNFIQEFSKRNKGLFTINITGSGDPFASIAYRNILESLKGKEHPNLRIELQTNGVMLTHVMWKKMENIHKNIIGIHVSVDAATSKVYEKIRKGGNFNQLIKNLEFLSKCKKQTPFYFKINFVLQQGNYHELIKFVWKFNRLNIDEFEIMTINDWGSMTKKDFNKACIQNPQHPEHSNFLSTISDPIFEMAGVPIHWGTLRSKRKELLEKTYPKNWLQRAKLKLRSYWYHLLMF
jgi:sulfatase maturation enzyme AslB (radical SAM superfamily)